VSRWRSLLGAALLLVPLAGCTVSTSAPGMPSCVPDRDSITLIAQSVPSATKLPCIAELPAGWRFANQEISSGRTRFWLESDIAGIRAVEVSLERACDVGGAVPVPSTAADELGLNRFDKPEQVRPLRLVRYYRFRGGCITYRYTFAPGTPSSLQFQADEALSFIERGDVVRAVRDFGFELCGANVPCDG
jgi:hypothetical protein